MSLYKAKNPFAALRYRDFKFFIGTQLTYTIGVLIQEVVLGYYLYDLTRDPLTLGIIGLLMALPYIALSLFGGYVADRFAKKKIALICILSMITISIFMTYGLHKAVDLNTKKTIIYTAVFCMGVARGFFGPAWSSLRPFLVKTEDYSNAASWSSQFWQVGSIFGPASAGFLYAGLGLFNTLISVIILFVFSLLFAYLISVEGKVAKGRIASGTIWQSLKEGFDFVRSSRILLYAMSLDMFSVLFGGVVAILPVFAKDILHVGPEELGIMRAAPGVGAVLILFLTAFYPPTRRAWRNMLLAVLGFGLSTLVFALSTNFYLSVFCLFLTGACDSISVIVRQTILQLMPPDHMRGRVNSISGIFVSCSNELGAFESGMAASLLGTVPSVIFGASMTIVVIGYIYTKSKDLLHISLIKEG
jgi:MFS family permease